MTREELVEELEQYPPDMEVRFIPEAYCPEGFPEWGSVTLRLSDDGTALIVDLLDEIPEEDCKG